MFDKRYYLILSSIIIVISVKFLFFNLNPFSSKANTFIPDAPADEWFEKQRAFPDDEIPPRAQEKAIEQQKQMPVMELNSPAPWVLAGPTNVEGRITTIAVHPTNPNIVYTGTANGGLWKSTNFCTSWSSVFDNQNTSSVGALAIDPANPNTVYCGTGESNSLRSYYPGTGIYKTTDGGTSWTSIGLQNTYSFGNIVINPSNSQIVYAAAMGSLRRKNPERGIYKSTNAGLTWIQSLYLSDSVGAIDVILDPSNQNKLFAAMWERQRREDYIKYGGPMTALYVTTNAGANWSVVNGGFPSNASDMGRISLDICSSTPSIVYAFTAYANGNSRGLYKSTDSGSSWSLINSGVAPSSNYAWFNRICKVNPANANQLFCGGLDMYMSVNGGTSFSYVSASHVDHHAVGFSPSNSSYIVIGNDGGIDYSTNGGTSWLASTTMPITQFYAGDIDNNNPSTILGGAQDNGTYKTTGSVGGWQSIYGGDGFYCKVDYNNSQYVYASSQNGALGRSTNGGSSFLSGTSGLDLAYSNWMTPYVLDKNDPQILYCGTYKIHKSTNRMQSWTAISPDLANGHVQNLGTITTVDVSKSNPNVIYCGTDDANIWVTTNGGTNWTKINSGLPYRWVTRVAVHNDSANVCYVTLSGYKVDSTGAHIFRTSNYGASWISVSGNLPNAPINDVIIEPYANGTLYIGTDIGVMSTTNYGNTWFVLETGIPSSVPCHDLTLNDATRKLVVWTHGRSAYYTILPFLGINSQNEIAKGFELFQNYPNPFNPSTKIKFTVPTRQSVTVSVYDITGRIIRSFLRSYKTSGTYEIDFDGSNLSSGVYFYKCTANGFAQTKSMILIK